MTDLATLRTSLEHSYDAIETLCATMDDGQWRMQSLCPAWTARDVISHLGMMERVMTGWLPADVSELPPLDRIAVYNEQTADMDNSSFAARIGEIFADRRTDLGKLQPEDLTRLSWTPIGPKTYGQFLEIRIFDFWVHERDIATPLGLPTDNTGASAEIALGQVEGSIGYIVGKKVGIPDGSSIVFHLTAPIKRHISVLVDGRAKQVDDLANPSVELTTDTLTFIQLAAGRIDPQTQIDSGLVTWTGDRELGERAARNLAFTI